MRKPPRHIDHPWHWRDWADLWLDFPLGRLLDYGCGPGLFLQRVRDRCTECHGVDVDPEKIRLSAAANPGATIRRIPLNGRTDYADEHFDTITLIEVIEHVPDERATLLELSRILKPGGKLLLTTPHRGLLTFLDPGNYKFIFPRLHRFVHLRILRQRRYYRDRFERSAKMGLVGDITAHPDRKPWHRHYYPTQIEEMCPPSLRVVDYSAYCPGMRAFWVLRVALRTLSFGLLRQLPPPLRWLEKRLSLVQSRTGDQLVMLLEKPAESLDEERVCRA